MKSTILQFKITTKTILLSLFVGILTGISGGIFHKATDWATEFRSEHLFLIYLLPIAGLLIVYIYNATNLRTHPGTNCILAGVRGEENIPIALAPNIFISTIITHLFGGSSGREGAALQLGGAIGSKVAEIFKADTKIYSLIILSGMSGAFSALFGTPLTAVVFAVEVCRVGTMAYSGLIPCMIASYIAIHISGLFGNHPVRFIIDYVPVTEPKSLVAVIILGLLCALVGSLFCKTTELVTETSNKINNRYLRIFAGGLVIVLLTKLLGTYDYNGAGMDIIKNAVRGSALPWAFILKIIFTAITLGVGFKGGEIIPAFFIGSTFGCVIGPIIGLDAGFAASVGICALFGSLVNCPIAALILSLEVFGNNGILLYAAAIFTGYAFSGYSGLYGKQIFTFSKNTYEVLNRKSK